MRIISLLLALLFACPWVAGAETLSIDPQFSIDFQLPSARWSFSRTPPEMLVAPMIADVEHDLQDQGKSLSRAEVTAMAMKRLAQNQGFIYAPATGSYLLIDFSPPTPGQKPPGDEDLEASAKMAGEILQGEPGVTGAQIHFTTADIAGARKVYQLDATYQQNGTPKAFSGLIGYAHPYWFFLYFTDTLKDPVDAREMAALLHSITLHGGTGN